MCIRDRGDGYSLDRNYSDARTLSLNLNEEITSYVLNEYNFLIKSDNGKGEMCIRDRDRNELSLSSLRVGYDFWKHNFIKKIAMERLRIEFYMNDVFMLSSIKTERGTAYPFARSFNFAIQATF